MKEVKLSYLRLLNSAKNFMCREDDRDDFSVIDKKMLVLFQTTLIMSSEGLNQYHWMRRY